MAFVRVGTLNDPNTCPPDIHLYTSTRLLWLVLDPLVPILPESYDRKAYCPQASLDRCLALLAKHPR